MFPLSGSPCLSVCGNMWRRQQETLHLTVLWAKLSFLFLPTQPLLLSFHSLPLWWEPESAQGRLADSLARKHGRISARKKIFFLISFLMLSPLTSIGNFSKEGLSSGTTGPSCSPPNSLGYGCSAALLSWGSALQGAPARPSQAWSSVSSSL